MDKTQTSIDHIELERRSHDKIKVNNPFDDDRPVRWSGFYHPVPAHGSAVLERFLADKWLEEQAKRIITENADKAIKDENKRRTSGGMAEMDKTMKTNEQASFESPYYANWQNKFKEVINQYGLFGGMVEEYGMQYIPTAQSGAGEQQLPNASLTDSLAVAPSPTPIPVPPTPEPPTTTITDQLEGKTQPELRGIAKSRGIATENTMKKADLLKLLTQ